MDGEYLGYTGAHFVVKSDGCREDTGISHAFFTESDRTGLSSFFNVLDL